MLSYNQSFTLVEKSLSDLAYYKEPGNLYDPVKYILSLGGKRIRPCLTLMAYSLFSDNIEPAISPALAIEIFHNFTLVHDDIMDNAPTRRNKVTVHKKWNTNAAILSGDAMMIIAYQLIAESNLDVFSKVFELFNNTALEVCEGQQYDMDFELNYHVSIDEYLKMIQLKTAVLLAASLAIGGILGKADDADINALYQFGLNVGMAFQLQDDYLDVFAKEAKFGKKLGGDIVANKKTYLLISALNSGNGSVEELKHWISQSPLDSAQKIEAVRKIFVDLGIDQKTKLAAEKYFNKGLGHLDSLSVPEDKKVALRRIVEELINREK